MVPIKFLTYFFNLFIFNDVTVTIDGNLLNEIEYKYAEYFRADIEKEIKNTSFPVDLNYGLSLKYTELKNYTVINRFDIQGYSFEYDPVVWNAALKKIYKKDYCMKSYYKLLPIKMSFILYYKEDHRFIKFTKPLKTYCKWGKNEGT